MDDERQNGPRDRRGGQPAGRPGAPAQDRADVAYPPGWRVAPRRTVGDLVRERGWDSCRVCGRRIPHRLDLVPAEGLEDVPVLEPGGLELPQMLECRCHREKEERGRGVGYATVCFRLFRLGELIGN